MIKISGIFLFLISFIIMQYKEINTISLNKYINFIFFPLYFLFTFFSSNFPDSKLRLISFFPYHFGFQTEPKNSMKNLIMYSS